jgi:hypothetical protein
MHIEYFHNICNRKITACARNVAGDKQKKRREAGISGLPVSFLWMEARG